MLLLFLTIIQIIPVHAASVDYIIDTDIGGDIDDVLALLVALAEPVKPLAITTTHLEPLQKARMAKLLVTVAGYPDIPVYAGVGTARAAPRDVFLQQNPLWPPAFGYPQPGPGESTWFIQQAIPYINSYGKLFSSLQIEKESAAEYIARIAKTYSPQRKLVIIALGPLHNVAAALQLDPTINQNIIIYSMGGIYPKGYNWLVSPATTASVFAEVETISVLSSLIEANQFYITPEEFSDLDKIATTQLGRAIIQDWKNWYKIDVSHLQKTHLSDPVTLYLALHPEFIISMQPQDITFPCLENYQLKPEFFGLWYNMPGLANKLIIAKPTKVGRVKFITEVHAPVEVKSKIISAIKKYVS